MAERGRGGWKTQGGGKHTANSAKNPSPKTFLDPPPTIRFPPPPFWRLSVISLKRKRHRPDQPQFLRPPKVGLESTLCSTVSPPQIHATRFAPPLSRCPNIQNCAEVCRTGLLHGFSGVLRGLQSERGSAAVCDPSPPRPFAGTICPFGLFSLVLWPKICSLAASNRVLL